VTLEYYSQDTHVLSAEDKSSQMVTDKKKQKNLAKTEQHNYMW